MCFRLRFERGSSLCAAAWSCRSLPHHCPKLGCGNPGHPLPHPCDAASRRPADLARVEGVRDRRPEGLAEGCLVRRCSCAHPSACTPAHLLNSCRAHLLCRAAGSQREEREISTHDQHLAESKMSEHCGINLPDVSESFSPKSSLKTKVVG